jgi:hypothetical protein
MAMNTTVTLTKEDYELCMEFILKLRYLWGGVAGDFRSSGVKRDIGKYIHDHMGGKLGEIAVHKFLKREFGVEVLLDFEKYENGDDFSKLDIVGVLDDGKIRKPKLAIDIKDSKPTSRWTLIPADLSSTETADYYIIVSVDMPLDKLIHYFKPHLKLTEEPLKKAIPDFAEISATVIGFISKKQLKEKSYLFNKGTVLPELLFFTGRAKIPDELSKTSNAKKIILNIPGIGSHEFNVMKGKISIYSGSYARTRKGKEKVLDGVYIEAEEDSVLANPKLGIYPLKAGIYKFEPKELSALRENNFAVPTNAISSTKEDWEELIKKL